ncbi:MAG: hypothetical protein OEZ22_15030 [Spirochaetia bacterium]|nr:hypothetical protein [Spirochaetia bacterium]
MNILKKWYFWVGILFVFGTVGRLIENNKNELSSNNNISQTVAEKRQSDRNMIVKNLTDIAKKNKFKAKFEIDPNDDTTLIIHRESTMKPDEIENWTNYLYSVETSPEKIKEQGFNKVRIYTSVSKNIDDYSLKIL